MNIERAIEILKWPDTGAGTCPSMLESAEAGRMAAEALEIIRLYRRSFANVVLPNALRGAVMEQRLGVYTPGQRAIMSQAADALDAFAKVGEKPACEGEGCTVIWPDEDLNRRSGLLEDD